MLVIFRIFVDFYMENYEHGTFNLLSINLKKLCEVYQWFFGDEYCYHNCCILHSSNDNVCFILPGKKATQQISILFKAWVVIIQIQSEQNWVAIAVWFTFLLSDIANWAAILISVCYKLLYGVNIFYMHSCHVTLECPKPKHVENFQRFYGWSDFNCSGSAVPLTGPIVLICEFLEVSGTYAKTETRFWSMRYEKIFGAKISFLRPILIRFLLGWI